MENTNGNGNEHKHAYGHHHGHNAHKVKRVYGHIPDDKTIEYPRVNFLSDEVAANKALTLSKPKPKPVPTPKPTPVPVVTSSNLVANLPESQVPYDQGQLGSCTANGLAFLYTFDEIKQKNLNEFMASRLFIYYNERVLEGTVDQDAGAQIFDGVRALQTYGVCSEEQWPYDAPNFGTKPSASCYAAAKNCEAKKFYKLVDPSDPLISEDPKDQSGSSDPDKKDTNMSAHVKAALTAGYPVCMGFTVYDSFESDSVANTGVMPVPHVTSEQVMGGHCVVIVGHDDKKKAFLTRNSWGTGWGCQKDGTVSSTTTSRGYFWMPYAFVDGTDSSTGSPFCSDFWVITSVSSQGIAGDANELSPDVVNLDPGTNNGGVVNPNA